MNPTDRLANSIASATAAASSAAWVALVLMSGPSVPRGTLICAVLAVAIAAAAHKALQQGQYWVLILAASMGAMTPPDLGEAPGVFKYVGVFALGYALSAFLLAGALASPSPRQLSRRWSGHGR